MDRKVGGDRRAAPDASVDPGWATLIRDDSIGIDGDIERIIGLYQMNFGYTHDRANAALVGRISSFAGPQRAPAHFG
jgi:hypothetical protein